MRVRGTHSLSRALSPHTTRVLPCSAQPCPLASHTRTVPLSLPKQRGLCLFRASQRVTRFSGPGLSPPPPTQQRLLAAELSSGLWAFGLQSLVPQHPGPGVVPSRTAWSLAMTCSSQWDVRNMTHTELGS